MCAQRFQCNHVYLSDKLLLEGARTLVQEREGCDHAHTERLTNVEGSLKVMLLHLHTPNGNTVHMDVENKSGKHNYLYIYCNIYRKPMANPLFSLGTCAPKAPFFRRLCTSPSFMMDFPFDVNFLVIFLAIPEIRNYWKHVSAIADGVLLPTNLC